MAPVLGAAVRGLPLVGRTAGAVLGGAQSDPRAFVRGILQGFVVLGGASWIVFGLNGRRIAKQMEEGKDRIFDAAAFEFSGGGALGAKPDGGGGNAGAESKKGSVDDWIRDGFKISGAFPYSDQGHNAMHTRIMQESGGDPNAVNNWDSNSAAGTPSKGLVQIIKPTWEANAVPGYENFDKWWAYPRLSVATSLNYMKARYGYIVGANGQGY